MSAARAAAAYPGNDNTQPRHAPAEAETLAALEARLRELASAVFNDDPPPLAGGTRGKLSVLLDRCPWTVGEFDASVILRFLEDWTHRPAYLAAVARGDERCNLDGSPYRRTGGPRLPERDGVLAEIVVQPAWAHGIDLKNSSGWQLRQLIQHAGTDPARLQQIADARGYKPGWVYYVLQGASQ